jgi:S-DNA-T family DNA segregation ATPase FtsK/SpoIIIE
VFSNESVRRQSKYRLYAVLCSLALGILGVFLCSSIIAAFFEYGGGFSLPGSLFVRSYGFLAFLIPAWLFYAAYLLADPFYRPDQIFLLCSLALPFFTLSLGIFWIREFETYSVKSVFLSNAGKLGIGLTTFSIAVLEICVIALLRFLLFTRKNKKTAGIIINQEADNPAQQEFAEPFPASGAFTEKPTETQAAEHNGIEPQGTDPQIIEPEEIEPQGIELKVAEPEPLALEPFDETETDEDVEKALAEAEAHAAAFAEEEAARHGAKKSGRKTEGGVIAKMRGRPYFVPVEGILKQYPDGEYWIIDDETRSAAVTLKETFKEFNIQIEVTGIRKGPVITMFEILPAPGIRLARIESLADNIALRLAAQSVRIVAPIPGKHAVGIEVPNAKRNIVSFREIIEGELNRDGKKAEVPIVLGKDITGETVTVDLVQMAQLLIAGATG